MKNAFLPRPFLVLLVASLLCTKAFAQSDSDTREGEISRLQIDNYCQFGGEKIEDELWTFTSDNEARKWVEKISKQTGVEPNFRILAGNVANAVAVIQGEERVIVYNQSFMQNMNTRTGTGWASISILAHEIGHHLQGHTLKAGGSRPNSELEADRFSGFVLRRMGASLDEAQAAMRSMNSSGSSTHPPSSARLAAISNGWKAADELVGEVGRASRSDLPDVAEPQEPAPQLDPTDPILEQSPSNPTPNIVANVTFYSDPNRYFLTSDGMIMAVTGLRNNRPILWGRQIPSQDLRFAWLIQSPRGIYPVDNQGIIVGSDPYGNAVQVGYVSSY